MLEVTLWPHWVQLVPPNQLSCYLLLSSHIPLLTSRQVIFLVSVVVSTEAAQMFVVGEWHSDVQPHVPIVFYSEARVSADNSIASTLLYSEQAAHQADR